VSKAISGSLIALTVAAVLSGCAKKEDAGTAAAPEQPAATTAASATQPADPHPMPGAPAAEVDLSGIAKAEGGKTVEEIYAEKDQLAGQKVSVRGKVVKVNPSIMDKNWLHVRDGSGAEGANDLTVTMTGELPKVGDTVVVNGQVTLNKDFGMGYQYPVIVEDATVAVE
jgi:hypothetical protein